MSHAILPKAVGNEPIVECWGPPERAKWTTESGGAQGTSEVSETYVQSGRRHYVDSLYRFVNFAYRIREDPIISTRQFESFSLEGAIHDLLVFRREADGYATEVVNVFLPCSLIERDGSFRQVDPLTSLIAALKHCTKLAVLVKAVSEHRCNDRSIRQWSAYITSRASTPFFVLANVMTTMASTGVRRMPAWSWGNGMSLSNGSVTVNRQSLADLCQTLLVQARAVFDGKVF